MSPKALIQHRFTLPILIALTIAVSLIGAGILVSRSLNETSTKPTLTVIGFPFDPVTLSYLESAFEAQDTFRSRINIRYIPPFKLQKDRLIIPSEYGISIKEDADVLTEEAKLVYHLFYNDPSTLQQYIEIRQSYPHTLKWTSFLHYTKRSPESLIEQVDSHDSSIVQELEDYVPTVLTLEKTLQGTSLNTPVLMLNDQIVSTGRPISPAKLKMTIARQILRSERPELPERSPFKLLGLTFVTSPYEINGIKEGYTDADCNDKPDQYGVLTNLDTPYTRCSYIAAEPLDVTVIAMDNLSENKQKEAENLQVITQNFLIANIKNAQIKAQRSSDLKKGSDYTEPLDGLPLIVMLEEDIENTPNFSTLRDQNFILESQGKYYLNLPLISNL